MVPLLAGVLAFAGCDGGGDGSASDAAADALDAVDDLAGEPDPGPADTAGAGDGLADGNAAPGDAALDAGDGADAPGDAPSDGGDGASDVGDADDGGGGPLLACPEGMVLVPAGPFWWGPPVQDVEQLVELPAFCIDVTEVPAGAFNACVADGGCAGYELWDLCAEVTEMSPSQCKPGADALPANWIDWYRADEYCAWAGKRLPTGREWEKAARGPDGPVYPWGDEITCADAHFARGDVFPECLGYAGLPDRPLAVDSYGEVPSPYGTRNQIGNVKEWIDHRKDPTQPPPEGEPGITRGGEWREGEFLVVAWSSNNLLAPDLTSEGHGFRCAAEPEGR